MNTSGADEARSRLVRAQILASALEPQANGRALVLLDEILEDQLQNAVMLEPDLVTIYAGMNNLLLAGPKAQASITCIPCTIGHITVRPTH